MNTKPSPPAYLESLLEGLPPAMREYTRSELLQAPRGWDQWFTFSPGPGVLWQWNIAVAYSFVQGREPDGLLALASIRHFSEEKVRIDPEHAQTVDLTRPLICVELLLENADEETEFAGLFPIDGWHRIARALAEGVTHLPYWVLSEEQNGWARFKYPVGQLAAPGQPLDEDEEEEE